MKSCKDFNTVKERQLVHQRAGEIKQMLAKTKKECEWISDFEHHIDEVPLSKGARFKNAIQSIQDLDYQQKMSEQLISNFIEEEMKVNKGSEEQMLYDQLVVKYSSGLGNTLKTNKMRNLHLKASKSKVVVAALTGSEAS